MADQTLPDPPFVPRNRRHTALRLDARPRAAGLGRRAHPGGAPALLGAQRLQGRTSTPPSRRWRRWASRAWSSPATTATRRTPPGLAAKLKALNLKAAGTHVRMDALRGDALKATIDFHQGIGCRFLVVPGDAAFTDPEKSKVTGRRDERDRRHAQAARHGDRVPQPRQRVQERRRQDVLGPVRRADVQGHHPAAGLRLDDGGGLRPGGVHPEVPGRTKTTHFKPTVKEGETGKKAIFGQDSVDWKSVYAACTTAGGTEWIVLEQEVYPDGKSPMDCTRESFAGLKAMLR